MRKLKVGFVGVGLMGLPMVKNIAKHNYPLVVWNRSTKNLKKITNQKTKVCQNLIDLPNQCQIIIMMLSNDKVCLEISKELSKKIKKNQILIDMSSTKQKTAIKIEKKINSKGGYFLDAPVSGGTLAAENGKLAIMVGGEKTIFEKTKNLLKSMGTVTYVGKTGSGQVAKLANQAIVGITIGAVSEALILAEAAGVDPKAVRKAIKNGFAGSPILEIHGKRILEKNFEPGGRCSTQLKDMNNIIETAKNHKIHLPLSEKIKKLYEKIVEEGKSNLDHSALYLLLKNLRNPRLK
jgi:2-hydroxy-3-oxopropionate reductase|tara:strand:+ start:64 stop:942 length:879 start_codon:yes stop_codon:yes gene_type:complete